MVITDCIDPESLRPGVPKEPQRPPSIVRFHLPGRLLEETRSLLWRKGQQGLEELVLWSGYILPGGECLVTTYILPATESSPAFVTIRDTSELTAISHALVARRQLVFAQVHAHPGRWVDPSGTDLAIPFSHSLGFLFVILPSYARDAIALEACGIHEVVGLDAGSSILTRRLPPSEVASRFRIHEGHVFLGEAAG